MMQTSMSANDPKQTPDLHVEPVKCDGDEAVQANQIDEFSCAMLTKGVDGETVV